MLTDNPTKSAPYRIVKRIRYWYLPLCFDPFHLLHCKLSLCLLRLQFGPTVHKTNLQFNSVAEPDPGSGAFLTPGSGIRDG